VEYRTQQTNCHKSDGKGQREKPKYAISRQGARRDREPEPTQQAIAGAGGGREEDDGISGVQGSLSATKMFPR
jgi:hypothetical protein